MIEAFRIVPEHRRSGAFDGEGARRFGGRWNHPGRPAVYTAGSRALAALEVLVHLESQTLPWTYWIFPLQIPKASISKAQFKGSAHQISQTMVDPATQFYGDSWLETATSCVLEVPSAIIPEEPNYLLNPLHPDFHSLRVGEPREFAFDPRLLNSGPTSPSAAPET